MTAWTEEKKTQDEKKEVMVERKFLTNLQNHLSANNIEHSGLFLFHEKGFSSKNGIR